MTKLRLLTAKELDRFVRHIGFVRTRQNGSHVSYRHPDGRRTTIPHHVERVINRSLLRGILREIKIDVETFNAILEKI